MSTSAPRIRRPRRLLAVAAAGALAVALSGCAQVVDAFNPVMRVFVAGALTEW